MSECTCYIKRCDVEHELDVTFSTHGTYLAATHLEPEEYPEIVVKEIWENPEGKCEFETSELELEQIVEQIVDYINEK